MRWRHLLPPMHQTQGARVDEQVRLRHVRGMPCSSLHRPPAERFQDQGGSVCTGVGHHFVMVAGQKRNSQHASRNVTMLRTTMQYAWNTTNDRTHGTHESM